MPLPVSIGSGRVVLDTSLAAWRGWPYRRAITVTNGGSAASQVQVDISLTSGNFDFTKPASDGSDIRFSDASGQRSLPYWIESYDSVGQTATIIVGLMYLPAGATTIYLYYGRSGVAAASNWLATFAPQDTQFASASPAIPTLYQQSILTGPGSTSAFGAICKLANSTILGMYTSGSGDAHTDMRVYRVQSTDDGLTWSARVLVFFDGTYGVTSGGGLFQLASGRIFIVLYYANGTTTVDVRLSYSDDNGATWSVPASVGSPLSGYSSISYFYGPWIELTAGGTIWAAAYALNTISSRYDAILLTSSDSGVTWTKKAVIAAGATSGTKDFTETAVFRFSSVNAVAFSREDNATNVWVSTSTDDGATWSTPAQWSPGVSPWAQILGNGHAVLMVGDRQGSVKGVKAFRSTDSGATWSRGVNVFGSITSTQNGYPTIIERANTDGRGSIGFGFYTNAITVSSVTAYFAILQESVLAQNWIETYELNTSLLDFPYVNGTGISISTIQAQTPTHALRINDTDSSQPQLIDGMLPGTTGDLTLWIYPITAPNGAVITIRDGVKPASGNVRFEFFIDSGGAFKYINSSSSVTALPTPTTLSFNAWHKVRLVWRSASDQCDVYIDGASKGTVGRFQSGGAPVWWAVQSGSGAGTGDQFYVDTVYQRTYVATLPTTSVGAEVAA